MPTLAEPPAHRLSTPDISRSPTVCRDTVAAFPHANDLPDAADTAGPLGPSGERIPCEPPDPDIG
jgi:hypothetical protein